VLDGDIPGDIAKARAVRKLVGDGFPLAFDANNGYSVGGAIRVGRALEELGYWWFEEPVQHFHVKAMGEVARGSTSPSRPASRPIRWPRVADLIDAGVRMVQPDIVKMGGITGLQRCVALAQAYGVETGAAPDPADDRPYRQPARRGGADGRDQAVRAGTIPHAG
jgi:L-alanine-DL-glutamate epimerase-like enolase superfamily enzyme